MSGIMYRINSLPLFVKLLALLLIVSLIPLIIALFTVYQVMVSDREKEASDLAEKLASTLQMVINDEGQTNIRAAYALAADSSLLPLVARKDHNAIKDKMMATLKNAPYRIVHVEDEKANVLFRSYDPDRWGDQTTLPMAISAVAGKPSADIVYGKTLGLSVRAAVPLKEGDRIIGDLMVGQTIDNDYARHLKDILSNDKVDVSYYWGNELKATTLKKKGTNDPVSGLIADPKIANQVITGTTPHVAWTPFEGKTYLMRYEPFNADGKPSGMVAVAVDRVEIEEGIAAIRNALLVTGGFVLVIVVAVSLLAARALAAPVHRIMQTLRLIGVGDFSARVPITSEDELGTLGTNVNAMLDSTLALIQTREERDTIQGEIEKLLDEVSTVAEGDLTAEAEVTPGMLGAVADSFNYMIAELRKIIANVHTTTIEVTSSTSQILASTQTLARGSEMQAQQISTTTGAVGQMAVSIQQVSENAGLSSQVAQEALGNARQGGEAVDKTIAAMTRIRDNAQETSKKIKRLGESSQEIGEIVQLIEDIADQTNLLALNAAIQAAMAGEHGRGFAVVADEVRRLAERSTDATKQISSLVKSIQTDTNEAVIAMEESTREVVSGSELADEAGRSLESIESVVAKLAELIRDISAAAAQQAKTSESIAMAMSEISEVTGQTSVGTRQTAASIDYLVRLAEQLRDSVSAFRLPPAQT